MKHGQVRLSGVGMVKLRGWARVSGVECDPQRVGGTEAMGLDWGVETFATISTDTEQIEPMVNPRFLDKEQRQKIKTLQHEVSRKTNKRSHHRRKAVEAGSLRYPVKETSE